MLCKVFVHVFPMALILSLKIFFYLCFWFFIYKNQNDRHLFMNVLYLQTLWFMNKEILFLMKILQYLKVSAYLQNLHHKNCEMPNTSMTFTLVNFLLPKSNHFTVAHMCINNFRRLVLVTHKCHLIIVYKRISVTHFTLIQDGEKQISLKL
jgi:hypothetical protein